jgi:hypothetical protein
LQPHLIFFCVLCGEAALLNLGARGASRFIKHAVVKPFLLNWFY